MNIEPIRFSAGTIERTGPIMIIRYIKDTPVSLDDMNEITAIRKSLFGEEKYCTLIDLRQDFLTISPEAKKFATENKNIKRLRIAEVLMVKNFGQKLGVHTYIKLFRSKDLVNVMTEETKAVEWLLEQHAAHFRKSAI